QAPAWQGPFIGSPSYPELNPVLNELGQKYGASPTAIATAWILRHPAKIQVVTGTTSTEHLKQAAEAGRINLSREEWYRLYLSAGHILP
ncbi:MAG: aldo/keto reductase, partial [Treponema sp.]|nr:aldo/keto reductase [Treponema sp.]